MKITHLSSLAALVLSAAAATAQAPAAPPAAPPPPPEVDVGKIAPDFTMEWADASGPIAQPVKLSELRGKVVVLAFYPADRSSGCTHELTKFRDEHKALFGEGTVVIPVSNDSISTHAAWAKEMSFPFALATDLDGAVAKQYGSWNQTRGNASRTVFVIGRDGRILWRNLKFAALNEGAYTEMAAEVAKARQ